MQPSPHTDDTSTLITTRTYLAAHATRIYGQRDPDWTFFMRLAFALLALLATLPACAEFPALDGTISAEQANAPFPDLVPLAPLLAQASTATRGPALTEASLAPRIANLRARAARLRGPVIPAAARTRMLRGVR